MNVRCFYVPQLHHKYMMQMMYVMQMMQCALKINGLTPLYDAV